MVIERSTKAGRKARQPPGARSSMFKQTRSAQRRPGERPGNRLDARIRENVALIPLNEGRAKGPATARQVPIVTLGPRQSAQRRPGERPGNRPSAPATA